MRNAARTDCYVTVCLCRLDHILIDKCTRTRYSDIIIGLKRIAVRTVTIDRYRRRINIDVSTRIDTAVYRVGSIFTGRDQKGPRGIYLNAAGTCRSNNTTIMVSVRSSGNHVRTQGYIHTGYRYIPVHRCYSGACSVRSNAGTRYRYVAAGTQTNRSGSGGVDVLVNHQIAAHPGCRKGDALVCRHGNTAAIGHRQKTGSTNVHRTAYARRRCIDGQPVALYNIGVSGNVAQIKIRNRGFNGVIGFTDISTAHNVQGGRGHVIGTAVGVGNVAEGLDPHIAGIRIYSTHCQGVERLDVDDPDAGSGNRQGTGSINFQFLVSSPAITARGFVPLADGTVSAVVDQRNVVTNNLSSSIGIIR